MKSIETRIDDLTHVIGRGSQVAGAWVRLVERIDTLANRLRLAGSKEPSESECALIKQALDVHLAELRKAK